MIQELLRQVLRDAEGKLPWIIFQGILETLIIISLIYLSSALPYAFSFSQASHRQEQKKIQTFKMSTLPFRIPVETEDEDGVPGKASPSLQKAPSFKSSDLLLKEANQEMDAALQEGFSSRGTLGSYLQLSSVGRFQNCLILMGILGQVSGLPPHSEDGLVFYASDRSIHKHGKTFSTGGRSFPLNRLDNRWSLLIGENLMTAKDLEFQDTLLISATDFEAIQRLFPTDQYPENSRQAWVNHLVFSNLSTDEKTDWMKLIFDSEGLYAQERSPAESQVNSASAPVKVVAGLGEFYLTTFLALFFASFYNFYQLLQEKKTDYRVHRLFGASRGFILARMLLLALLYHTIPFLLFLRGFILSGLSLSLPLVLLFSVPLVISLALAVHSYKHLELDG